MSTTTVSIFLRALLDSLEEAQQAEQAESVRRSILDDRVTERRVVMPVPMVVGTDGKLVFPLRYSTDTVLPIERGVVMGYAAVPPAGLGRLEITDVRLGNNSQFMSAVSLPWFFFDPEKTGGFGLSTWKPGQLLLISTSVTTEEEMNMRAADVRFFVVGWTECR